MDMDGVGDGQFPCLLEELIFVVGGVVAQCVGCHPELWAEAVLEVVHGVAIPGEDVFAVGVPCVVALKLSLTDRTA